MLYNGGEVKTVILTLPSTALAVPQMIHISRNPEPKVQVKQAIKMAQKRHSMSN